MAKAKMGRFMGAPNEKNKTRNHFRNHYTGRFSQAIDLSDYEERKDLNFFIEIGKQAAANAVNENKAMNIPVTFMQDGWVVRRMPQGTIERVVKIDAKTGVTRDRKLTKGTVLHVKKFR